MSDILKVFAAQLSYLYHSKSNASRLPFFVDHNTKILLLYGTVFIKELCDLFNSNSFINSFIHSLTHSITDMSLNFISRIGLSAGKLDGGNVHALLVK